MVPRGFGKSQNVYYYLSEAGKMCLCKWNLEDEIFKAIISLKRDTLPAKNAHHYCHKASVAKINYENRVIFGWYKIIKSQIFKTFSWWSESIKALGIMQKILY